MGSSIPSLLLEQLQALEPGAQFTGSLPRVVSSTGKHYFAKLGAPAEAEQYAGEAESLKHIETAAPGLAPLVFASGSASGHERPYLISEYKDLKSLNESATRRLAERLATELHCCKGLQGFGFHVATYCGATRLQNGWFDRWDECFSAQIGDLLSQLAKKSGYASLCLKGERVRKDVIPKLLGPLVIQPVLLHGDLWSGNVGQTSNGEPVIFDPASYYGHNEADLAIARIFGGFPKSFFGTYHEQLPKTEPVEQYDLRQDLYQLFHYLNHTLLFGGHYASSAESKMDTLLAAEL